MKVKSKRVRFSWFLPVTKAVHQVAILAEVDTHYWHRRRRGVLVLLRCSRFNVSIWLPPPRVVLPLLNRAITLHQPKKRSQKQSFVQDSRMSMHLSRSVGRVSAVTDCKHCCSVERGAMRAYAVTLEM